MKPRRHAPVGLLQPLPIPSQPLKVVMMDFIPELPLSDGYNNVLVIVDKLMKYSVFILTTVKVSEVKMAKLFFKHIVTKFRTPCQIISDCDTHWQQDFWKEVCHGMGMKQSLTTSYHPQADGQMEVMNQGLKISICAYINPSSPAYLLRGYHPITGSTLLTSPQAIGWDDVHKVSGEVLNEKALHLVEAFEAK